ncbi:MAG TPA: molybdopterin cofactor-binding domain-containing protein [Acidimicrobiales bacterium]|nr:molybdopterin cofactor-binding domain-containing protein [Acidimicrobiales bacterium]
MTIAEDRTRVVGTPLPRREDPALLTGEGKYTDDIVVPGELHLAIVRSPYAHARITSVDVSAARALPGIVAAYSGADLQGEWGGPMPCAWVVTPDMKNPPHYPLAIGTVNHVGDPVAVVVGEDPYGVKDAAEAVVVEYEPLDPVVDLEDALSDRVLVHADLGTNRAYTWELTPEPDKVDRAFAEAAHVVRERYVQQRLLPSPMEPRAYLAVPQPIGGEITIYSATQIPHFVKIFAALILGIPETKVRVIAPNVGGGFGAKLEVYGEEFLCIALARKLGRPVRWTEERSETATAMIQGRAQIQDIELAADAEGRVTAVRAELIADMGGYMMLITPGIPLLGAFLYHGVYDVAAYSFKCTGVFTTKTPTDAYRGAGRPEATYAIERAIDALAREVGVDPAEIRRRNFIRSDQFPYNSPAGLVFDSGDYHAALDKALALAGYDGLRAEQQRRRETKDRSQIGIGLSSYVEMCGLAPSRVLASLNYVGGGWESSTVRVLPTGKVQVVTGTSPHGQGHETCWSMIVADELGMSTDDIEVLHGDTQIAPHGLDSYGSRSLAVGGTAVFLATQKVIAKARTIAAHQLEAAEEDLQFEGGAFSVRGTPTKSMPLAAVAFEAFTAHNLPDGMEPTLEATSTWDPPNFVFPFGTHVAVVEVDTDIGDVKLRSYTAVDDCGNQVNPLIVEGQVHGGVVQGIAQALFEEAVYDSDGNLVTATLADYLVPSAAEFPSFTLGHTVTPSPTNPMGVKGIGEAGTIASTPAVINAVVDALAPYGVRDIAMPASPWRVWKAIQEGGRQ